MGRITAEIAPGTDHHTLDSIKQRHTHTLCESLLSFTEEVKMHNSGIILCAMRSALDACQWLQEILAAGLMLRTRAVLGVGEAPSTLAERIVWPDDEFVHCNRGKEGHSVQAGCWRASVERGLSLSFCSIYNVRVVIIEVSRGREAKGDYIQEHRSCGASSTF